MWSKLTNVLKSRTEHDPTTATTTHPSSSRFLSIGRSHGGIGSDHHLPLPAASPPSSPSRHGRLGLFKRNSKAVRGDINDSSSFCLPHLPLPKKRSNLQMNAKANGSTASLRPSFDGDAPPRSSCETAIARPQTPSDSQRLSMALGNGSGSVRSILRDRNTPGTGQNVRFFSRDAYRVISPDVSTTSPDNSNNDPPEPSFQQRMSQANIDMTPLTDSSNQGVSGYQSAMQTMGETPTPRPPTPIGQSYQDAQLPSGSSDGSHQVNAQSAYADAQSMSSPGAYNTRSMIVPMPPPDNSDIFDLSAAGEHGVQAIPMAPGGAILQDGAVEVEDDEEAEIIGRVSSPVVKAKITTPEKENVAPPVVAEQQTRTQITFAVSEADSSNPLLTVSNANDKQKGKSIGRKAGESIFHSLTNALSDNDSKSIIIPPRASSSLGLYKLFSANANGSSSSISNPPAATADKSATSSIGRSRAYSASVFQRPVSSVPERTVSDPARTNRYADPNMPARPESMIDTSAVMVYPPGNTPDSSPSKVDQITREAEMPDPFRADARTYYTPDVGVPNSPPPPKLEPAYQPQHGRSASVSGASVQSATSRVSSHNSSKSFAHNTSASVSNQVGSVICSGHDDMILALRTQLTFHQELSVQYEADLSARDELVSVLSSQLATTKSELDSRTRIAKAARQKVGHLEKAYRSLERACLEMEEEVERSRLDSAERSVMDEASGEALRALHGVIAKLEKEKEKLKVDAARASTSVRERSMNVNGSGSVGMNETGMSVDEVLNDRLRETQEERASQEERHRAAELAWEEERGTLMAKVQESESLQAALEEKEAEMDVLRKEVEAQWAGTERMNARIDDMKAENEILVNQVQTLQSVNVALVSQYEAIVPERDELKSQVEALKEDIAALEARTNELEVGWTDGENRKGELEKELEQAWAVKEELENEREQLHFELAAAQEQFEHVKTELVNAEARLASFDQESQFTSESVTRLESLLSERDTELNAYAEKYNRQTQELEDTRDQLSALRREYQRASTDYDRKLADIASRHEETRREAENAIRERAAIQVELDTFKQRVSSMEEDLEKARRQVHVLRQESADQEVKITHLKQQREKDEEDKLGLNIALDSKQQELELLKRKMNLAGTAGSTSVVASRVGNRRESAAFTTPMPSRPPSAQSETGSKTVKAGNTTITSRTTLGRTFRANSLTSGGSTTNILPPSVIKIKAPRASVGHMLPPSSTVRPRGSLSSSVSSLASSTSLSRSTTAIPRGSGSTLSSSTTQRRQSAILSRSLSSKNALSRSSSFEPGSQSDASSIPEDKENAQPTPRASIINATVGAKARRMSSYTPKPMPA